MYIRTSLVCSTLRVSIRIYILIGPTFNSSLDKQWVAAWAKGLVVELANTAVDMVEAKRTVQVFSQLDTPVRDWVLGQGVPGTISDTGTSVQTVPVEVHQSIRPITPTMRSPVAGKGWSPISTPDRASVTGTPKTTPGQKLRIGGSPAVPLHGSLSI